MAKCGVRLGKVKDGDTGTSILSVLLSLAAQKRGIHHIHSSYEAPLLSSLSRSLSAPLPKISLVQLHPAPLPSPPFSYPITHYPLDLLDLWAHLPRLSGATLCWRSESVPTSSLLHYNDYRKKSYITWGPHGTYGVPLRPLPFSSSVPSPLFPFPSFLSRD